MADATDHALQAAVKALAEVVGPAVDPADALAVDQLRLAVSWLQFHGQRRPDERRMAWATLRQRLAFARAALAVLHTPGIAASPALARASDALAAACAGAAEALVRHGAPTGAWRTAAELIDTALSRAVDLLAEGPTALRGALAQVVIDHSRDSLMLQRAWFAPLGFEARPDAVPPLEALLSGAPPG